MTRKSMAGSLLLLRLPAQAASPGTFIGVTITSVQNRPHPAFKFRASLGPERYGPEGFIEYMRSVHAALANYTCVIDDLLVAGNLAAARMTFKGLHCGRFFGVEVTGREIQWAGGAFFTTNGEQIVELWVLGDIDSVKQQLNATSQAVFASG